MFAKLSCGETIKDLVGYLKGIVMYGSYENDAIADYDARVDFYLGTLFGCIGLDGKPTGYNKLRDICVSVTFKPSYYPD